MWFTTRLYLQIPTGNHQNQWLSESSGKLILDWNIDIGDKLNFRIFLFSKLISNFWGLGTMSIFKLHNLPWVCLFLNKNPSKFVSLH